MKPAWSPRQLCAAACAWMVLVAGCDATFQFIVIPAEASAPGVDGRTVDATTPDASGSEGGRGFAPPCYKDDDCPVSKLHCNIATGQCVECLGDRNCVVAPYPFCDLAIERCVGCRTTADCRTNEICDDIARVCLVQCATATNCPSVQPLCNAAGSCMECINGDECPQHQVCDFRLGRCVGCVDDKQCAAPALYCDVFNPEHMRCKECLSSAACPQEKPYCDLHGGICVALIGP